MSDSDFFVGYGENGKLKPCEKYFLVSNDLLKLSPTAKMEFIDESSK